MGGGTPYGLGRRNNAAPSRLLSAASGTSPPDSGRRDDPGHEGAVFEEAVQYDELAAKADLIAVGAVDL
jgi:hypothetical protein